MRIDLTASECEWLLTAFRLVNQSRDALIVEAYNKGISRYRIFVLTGIARTTINRIIENSENDV